MGNAASAAEESRGAIGDDDIVQTAPMNRESTATTQNPVQLEGIDETQPKSPTRSKKLDRADILRRARSRREQLAKELARTKIELWETTIEQGVLTHISKDKELSSAVS